MIKIRSGKWALCALVLSFMVLYVAFIKCGPTHYAAQYDEGLNMEISSIVCIEAN
jgi:hypothetical protein